MLRNRKNPVNPVNPVEIQKGKTESHMEDEEITRKIIGCAMKVHRALGPGFLESVYESAFAHELAKTGLRVECQAPIKVHYDGVVVGDFIADMRIEGRILIENKAVQRLTAAHEVQLVNYLAATGAEVGLLINFGADSLQFKRKHRSFAPRHSGQD
jgi:GxxExxY protein